MPKRSNQFQRLITFLERQLSPAAAIITAPAMVVPIAGGTAREVDILIEARIGAHAVRIAVECRDHGRKQTVDWIEALIGKFNQLPIHKVVAVSRSGFTKGAQARAEQANITAISLKRALDADWHGTVSRWGVGLVVWDHPLTAAEVNYHDSGRLDLSGAELRTAPIEDDKGQRISTFEKDVLALYRTHAARDVKKWATDNAGEIFRQGAGHKWDLRLPFHAHDRFLVARDGTRHKIKEVILCLTCQYRIEAAELSYFMYQEHAAASAALEWPSEGSRYEFALLFDNDGQPTALNLHVEPPVLPGT